MTLSVISLSQHYCLFPSQKSDIAVWTAKRTAGNPRDLVDSDDALDLLRSWRMEVSQLPEHDHLMLFTAYVLLFSYYYNMRVQLGSPFLFLKIFLLQRVDCTISLFWGHHFVSATSSIHLQSMQNFSQFYPSYFNAHLLIF